MVMGLWDESIGLLSANSLFAVVAAAAVLDEISESSLSG